MEARFGKWTENEGSARVLRHPEDPLGASWECSKLQILENERLGFESTLPAQQVIDPDADHDEELGVLRFQPFEPEMRHCAHAVRPRLRRLTRLAR